MRISISSKFHYYHLYILLINNFVGNSIGESINTLCRYRIIPLWILIRQLFKWLFSIGIFTIGNYWSFLCTLLFWWELFDWSTEHNFVFVGTDILPIHCNNVEPQVDTDNIIFILTWQPFLNGSCFINCAFWSVINPLTTIDVYL